ncbi:MAG: hypothetical protein AAGF24_03505 [Cyanobacteria bacterium P01_H01_bin.121]
MPALGADFLGSAWSPWPPHNLDGSLNIVSGPRKITADIISVCLIRRGEDPLHPDLGMAPLLFEPLSNYDPQFWVYEAESTIKKWVAGIDKLTVRIPDYEDYKNRLTTEISFIPLQQPDLNILTFPWYTYEGALWDQNLQGFLRAVSLNGQPFFGLT